MKRSAPTVAICLLSDDPVRSREQKQSLIALEQSFNIEWVLRSEVSPYTLCTSYSQAVNEAVLLSTAEYIMFFNPRLSPYPEDVTRLYDDLNNGFCLSLLASMGGWGVSRELFKVIGLFDERFLGGEYEDNDFLVRIRQAGYAIKWRFDKDRYPVYLRSGNNPLFGLSKSLYKTKWYEKEGVYYRTDLFRHEKRLPLSQLSNPNHEVRKSWKKWEDSDVWPKEKELTWHIYRECDKIKVSNEIASSSVKKVNINILFSKTIIDTGEEHVRIDATASDKTSVDIGLCSTDVTRPKEFLGDGGVFTLDLNNLWNRWWSSVYAFPKDGIEVRIFHQGKLILYNSLINSSENAEYNLTVDHYNFHVP